MSENSLHKQLRENGTDDLLDDYSKKDERTKVRGLNKVFRDNEQELRMARKKLSEFHDRGVRDEAVIGHLFWLAHYHLQQGIQEERIHGRDVEGLQDLEQCFVEICDPVKMKRLSQKASDINRTPAAMRRLLDDHGRSVQALVSRVYAGTEVQTEGSIDEDDTQTYSDES